MHGLRFITGARQADYCMVSPDRRFWKGTDRVKAIEGGRAVLHTLPQLAHSTVTLHFVHGGPRRASSTHLALQAEEEDGMAGAQWKMSPYCSLSSLLSPGIKGDKSVEGKGRKGLNGEMITQPDSRLSLIALSHSLSIRGRIPMRISLSRDERV